MLENSTIKNSINCIMHYSDRSAYFNNTNIYISGFIMILIDCLKNAVVCNNTILLANTILTDDYTFNKIRLDEHIKNTNFCVLNLLNRNNIIENGLELFFDTKCKISKEILHFSNEKIGNYIRVGYEDFKRNICEKLEFTNSEAREFLDNIKLEKNYYYLNMKTNTFFSRTIFTIFNVTSYIPEIIKTFDNMCIIKFIPDHLDILNDYYECGYIRNFFSNYLKEKNEQSQNSMLEMFTIN